MKTQIQKLLLALLLGNTSLAAYAQGTAFTYTGRINENGAPVNGAYDLRFTIYDVNVAGNVIAGPLNVSPVDVVNGVFTVRLDFGAGIFTGPLRWLSIEVRPVGGVNFTLLDPRQEVTSSPYAIHAASAGSVASGAVTANQLNTGGVAPAPGQILSYNGGNLFWSDPGVAAGNIFSLNGNNAYYNTGNVGLGTSTPAHRLSLSGGPFWTANQWLGAVEFPNGAALGWQANQSGQRFGMGHSSGGFYLFRTASNPGTTGSPALYDFMVNDAGNVGIGTTTPASKLTVSESGYGLEHNNGTVRLGTYVDSSGGWLGTISNDRLKFFVNNGVLPSMTVDTTGNVGIGTTSPGSKLEVAGNVRINGRINVNYHGGGVPVTMNIQASEGDIFPLNVRANSGSTVFYLRAGATHELYMLGDAYKSSGGTAWIVSSDQRLKQDVRTYEPGLNEILRLRAVRFRYRGDPKRGLTSTHEEVGFIAQEVREVIPDAVTEGQDGYLMLKADPIHWAAINAIQELNTKLEEQRVQNAALNERLERLERLMHQQNEEKDAVLQALKQTVSELKAAFDQLGRAQLSTPITR